jgi:hypothetical protein
VLYPAATSVMMLVFLSGEEVDAGVMDILCHGTKNLAVVIYHPQVKQSRPKVPFIFLSYNKS